MNRKRQSNKVVEFIKTPIVKHILLAVCLFIVAFVVVNILLNVLTRHGQVHQVPDFSGMSVDEATFAGSGAELRITINDSLYVEDLPGGVVLEQNPAPGSKVKSNRHIFVTINSFAQRLVEIPYVTGYSLRQAKNNLEVAGLTIDKLVYTDDIATNNVIAQHYNGKIIEAGSNEEAPKGAGITLVVGRADAEIVQEIPVVVGQTLAQAQSRLWESGLNIGRIEYGQDVTSSNAASARVNLQTPYGGNYAKLGDQVNLRISLNDERITAGVRDANTQYKQIEEERQKMLELDSLNLETLLQNE